MLRGAQRHPGELAELRTPSRWSARRRRTRRPRPARTAPCSRAASAATRSSASSQVPGSSGASRAPPHQRRGQPVRDGRAAPPRSSPSGTARPGWRARRRAARPATPYRPAPGRPLSFRPLSFRPLPSCAGSCRIEGRSRDSAQESPSCGRGFAGAVSASGPGRDPGVKWRSRRAYAEVRPSPPVRPIPSRGLDERVSSVYGLRSWAFRRDSTGLRTDSRRHGDLPHGTGPTPRAAPVTRH